MQKNNENRIISLSAAEKLIRAHDGNMALLYIYMASGGKDLERAADALCLTLSELKSAEEKLQRAGLLPIAEFDEKDNDTAQTALKQSQELPSYSGADAAHIASTDSDFKAVLDEAEAVFGKPLSSDDTKRLCSIYKYLGLPADVLFVLLHHCAYLAQSSSRKLSLNFIEKQAYKWVEKELFTAEAAEGYSEHIKETRTIISDIKSRLDIRDRNLTESEETYFSSWLEMGFDADTIYEAYDLTITNTGKRAYKYMNGILLNWHTAGLHSIEAIRASQQPQKSTGSRSNSSNQTQKINTNETIGLLDKV